MSGDRHADDIEQLPLIQAVTRATGRVVDAKLADHERRLHDGPDVDRTPPGPRTEPLAAIPWPNLHIPDAELAHICEVCEEEGLTLEEAAARFGWPVMLLERELLSYARLHRLWALERALRLGAGV